MPEDTTRARGKLHTHRRAVRALPRVGGCQIITMEFGGLSQAGIPIGGQVVVLDGVKPAPGALGVVERTNGQIAIGVIYESATGEVRIETPDGDHFNWPDLKIVGAVVAIIAGPDERPKRPRRSRKPRKDDDGLKWDEYIDT